MAFANRKAIAGLLFHSDRGVQYCAGAFRDALPGKCHTVRRRQRGKGNCRDNDCAESFFKTLKSEPGTPVASIRVKDILLTHTGPVYLGKDFARSGDLTIINLDKAGGGLRSFLVIKLRNVIFDQQRQVVKYIMDTLPDFSGDAFDARGTAR